MSTYKDLVSQYSSATGAILMIESMITNKKIEFPAFLTNVSQNFKSSWQTENVFGRNDPIATFQHTTRTVSLGWTVPAASLQEAKNNEKKISNLISFLYPGYYEYSSPSSTETELTTSDTEPKTNVILSKSPLVKVKFANVIQAQDGGGLLGWIDGVDWKPKLDVGMFAEAGNFYAKTIDLSFTLNVLHQKDVGFDQTGGWLGNSSRFPFKLE
jgi:hypothetical protein|tara:strand:- start:1225 stop:1863 length:639 start_codon:yes stop_codon:yes gene_type:complete